MRDPTYAEVLTLTGPLETWVDAAQSTARFAAHHFSKNRANALPFDPRRYRWSPTPIYIPVIASTTRTGHYRRGVRKYLKALEQNTPIAPVAFLWDGNHWTLQDGNHRYEAHFTAKKLMILAIFAIPNFPILPKGHEHVILHQCQRLARR